MFLRGQECPRSYSQALGFRTAGESRVPSLCLVKRIWIARQSEAATEIGNFSVPIF